MKVAFIFGVFIALVSITLSNGLVVVTQDGKNNTQEQQPNKNQELQKEALNKVEPNQNKETQNQNQTAKNVNEAQNQTQQIIKKSQQQNEKEKPGQSRRSFADDISKYKRFEVRKRAEDTEAMRAENEVPELRSRSSPQELESIVMAIDTGAKPARQNEDKFRANPDPVDRIEQLLQDITKTRIPSSVIYRAKQDLDIKPSFIRFRSSQQPSLKLEVSSSSIVKALETLLSTPEARRYADVIGQQAAVMYRSMSDKQAIGMNGVKKRNPNIYGYADRTLYNKQ